MHFATPFVLRLLPAVLAALTAVLAVSEFLRRRRLAALFDRDTLPHGLRRLGRLRFLKDILLSGSVALMLLALARPQWGRRIDESPREGRDIVLAVDVSLSMLAEDLPPNRLERVRSELSAFLDGLGGDRVGLVVFAGKAYLQCPLTLDHGAVRMYLDLLDPALVPVPGTALADAIREASRAFEPSERQHKVLILLTDGEDHEGGAIEAARQAAAEGVIFHVVGVGSAAGEPIPLRDAEGRLVGYKKDRQGRVVTTRLNEPLLKTVAETGGGRYIRAGQDAAGLRSLLAEIGHMDRKTFAGLRVSRYEERFAWFLVPGILLFLAAVAWPEGRLVLSVLLVLLPASLPADTAGLNNKANRLYARGRVEEALRLYEEALAKSGPKTGRDRTAVLRHNIATAWLRLGDTEKALESYTKAFDAQRPKVRAAARYGAGLAHLRRGDRDAALREFIETLKIDPSDRDAKRALEYLLRQRPEQRPPTPAPGTDKDGRPQQQQSGGGPEERPGGMTREEAERVLRGLEEAERQSLDRNRRRLFGNDGARYVEKDW